MLFESTTLLLQSVVHSLESGGDETTWDDYLEFGNQCVYELHQMSRPSNRIDKSRSSPNVHAATAFERAVGAIPHVKSMNMSIRRKDRTAAIESGKAAIAQMNGIGIARLSAPVIGQPAGSGTSPKPVEVAARKTERHGKSGENNTASAKRRPATQAAAGTR